jgi:hypothetical protein
MGPDIETGIRLLLCVNVVLSAKQWDECEP